MTSVETTTEILSADISYTKTEIFDCEFARQLLNNKDIAKEDRDKLRRFVKGSEKGNRHITTYKLGKDCKHEFLGRLIALKGESLQALPKDIRHAISNQFYHDIDMVNAQPTILYQYCEKQGWKCDAIKKYVSQREELLNEICESLNVQRWEAKDRVISLFFGSMNISGLPSFFNDELLPEIRSIMHNNYKVNNDKLKFLAKQPNHVGKALAYILQTEERTCLLAMDRSLSRNKRNLDVYIHDGGLVLKKENETTLSADLIQKIEQDVLKETGYKIQLIVKPMKTSFSKEDIDENLIDESISINDKFAALKFIEFMGDNLVYCKGILYIYDQGLYSSKEEVLDRHISKANLIFKQKGLTNIVTFDYSGSYKKKADMKRMLLCELVSQDTFMDVGREKACYKLLFQNGIFDFKSNSFNKEFDKTIVFDHRIPHDYYDDPLAEDVDFVNKTLFEDPFMNTETPTIFKHYLMRGIVGDYRAKKFLAVLGNTNSSKGTITNFFEYVFGSVVSTFNSNELIIKRESNSSRDLSFALDFCNSRLAISSEIKLIEGCKIDSNLMKNLVSGGDSIKARRLYKENETFVNYAMPILFANDLPDFAPIDDAIRERLIVIQYDYSFVNNPNPENQFEKQGNANIKNILQQQKYANAFISMIMQEYNKWEENDFKEPILPKYLLEDRNTMAKVSNIKTLLEEQYVITQNEDDYIPSTDLQKFFKDNEVVMSDTKLGKELTKLGMGSKLIKIDKKVVRCRTGIKIIEQW
jgi:phage/plasmid-associated DNA primase